MVRACCERWRSGRSTLNGRRARLVSQWPMRWPHGVHGGSSRTRGSWPARETRRDRLGTAAGRRHPGGAGRRRFCACAARSGRERGRDADHQHRPAAGCGSAHRGAPPPRLAAALVTCDGSLAGAQVLWPRSDIAGRELPDALTAAGALVIEPEAYRTSTTQPNALGTFTAMLDEGSVEAVAFFSPSAATGLARAFDRGSMGALASGNGSTLARLAGRTEVASIGPSTSAALEALGARVTIESETRAGSELATAILRKLARRKGAA